MAGAEFNTIDFPKHYQVDSEGFICFINENGERTRIARILRNGDIEVIGKTKISDPYAKKKGHFFVKTFLLLFLFLIIGSAGAILFLYQRSLKQNEEYLKLKSEYDAAVSEIVLGCKAELKKIEDFINDQEEHQEDEIEELIKKLRNISPNYCQVDTEVYPKFTELSRTLYVMKGKIGGKREAEEKQKKELEQQLELERQQELERLKREEEQKKLEEERKKLEEEARKIEKARLEKEEAEKRKKIEDKTKTTKSGVDGNPPKPGGRKNAAPNTKEQDKTVVKATEKAKENPKEKNDAQNEEPEEVSKLKREIDKLEEWLKSLKR